jgi:hypothetical protein
MSIVEGRQGTRRFSTCTDNAAAARSTVEALTFPAVTRTLLFDHTWQSSTKAMLLVSSDASAKSPRRARHRDVDVGRRAQTELWQVPAGL